MLSDASTFCDELVVVDTGSTDATKDVALEHGAKVFDFEWIDNFAAARNYSFRKCRGQWIVWLDADDRVPPDAQRGFAALKGRLARLRGAPVKAAAVPYRYAYADDNPALCLHTIWRERVVRPGAKWSGAIHESIDVDMDAALKWPAAWVEHRPQSRRHHKDSEERNYGILRGIVDRGDRSPPTLYNYAQAVFVRGRFADALALFDEALRASQGRRPWFVYELMISEARCASRLGWADKMEQMLTKAIDYAPERADAYVMLGELAANSGDHHRAIELFTRATQLSAPDDGSQVSDGVYSWEPWQHLAHCYDALGMAEERKLANTTAQGMIRQSSGG